MWWYGLVGLAAILAALWALSVVVGFLLGLVKAAVLLILAVAIVSWVLGNKAAR
jgi:hypothetical protein